MRSEKATRFIFQFDPADSVKIRCAECVGRVRSKELSVEMDEGKAGVTGIGEKKLEKWLPLHSMNGKFGLIFQGEKDFRIPDIEIVRKSDSSKVRPGPDPVPLEVKSMFLRGMPDASREGFTRVILNLRRKDEVELKVTSVSGDPKNVVCKWFEEGELFDFDYATPNEKFSVPASAPFTGTYVFQFSPLKPSKDNFYNIRLMRLD